MKSSIKNLSATRKQLDIEVSSKTLEGTREKAIESLSKEAKIPGFRPGKVPREVIEKNYAQNLKQKIVDQAIPVFCQKAIEENNLSVVSFPNIENVDFSGENLKFRAVLDVKPEVEVADKIYKGMKLDLSSIEVKKEEIDKVVSSLKESLSKSLEDKEFDDEFLSKWMGYRDLEECREGIRYELWINKFIQRRKDAENKITKTLLEKVKVEAPLPILEQQRKMLFNNQLQELQSRGVKQEDLNKYKEEIEKKVKPIAEDQVRLYYIFEKIAEQEKLASKDDNRVYEKVLGYIISNAKI